MKTLAIKIALWVILLIVVWAICGKGGWKRRIIRALFGGLLIILVLVAIVALTHGLSAAAQLAANRWGIKLLERTDDRIALVIATAIVCGMFSFLSMHWNRRRRPGSR